MRLTTAFAGALIGLGTSMALAQQPVPEIKVLTWPAAKYQHYFETSNYVAEGWRKLGLDGTELQLSPDSICVHGDTDGAVAVARAVREKLETAGVAVKPFATR